jgi:S-adenosylmethionine hydrolase
MRRHPSTLDPIVTLLTDFGDEDGFVGAMRGVVMNRAPQAKLIDLAHHVPQGDVPKASRVLWRSAHLFPPGTIHLVVVDPGVGSARPAIAASAGQHYFVAPDNGVLDAALRRLGGVDQAVMLDDAGHWRTRRPSGTFHGRDIFAPAAGALADGVPLSALGSPHAVTLLPEVNAYEDGEGWTGQVVEVDRFGNLITDIRSGVGPIRLDIAGTTISGPAPSYTSVGPGALVVVVGSEETLEIAVRDGSAAQRLGVGVGTEVRCRRGGR